ncbi:hypothetical protein ACOIVE_004707, partial [Vibrio parahaemolyticus]
LRQGYSPWSGLPPTAVGTHLQWTGGIRPGTGQQGECRVVRPCKNLTTGKPGDDSTVCIRREL